jgi:ABC-2 type transport system permease protein
VVFKKQPRHKTFWDLVWVGLKVIFYLLLGIFIFQVDFSRANWTATLAIAIFTAGTFLGLGMISASYTLVFREASPVELVLGGASRFLAGVYFPIALFPEWLRNLSVLLPLTQSLEAIRKSLILGAPVEAVAKELSTLSVFSLVLLPLGLIGFRWALKEARLRGNLGFE